MSKKPNTARQDVWLVSALPHNAEPLSNVMVSYKYVFDSSVAKYIPTLDGTLQFCRMLVHCEFLQLAS